MGDKIPKNPIREQKPNSMSICTRTWPGYTRHLSLEIGAGVSSWKLGAEDDPIGPSGFLCDMGVSENCGTPKSSILKHPFWGTRIFGNTHMILIHYWWMKHFPRELAIFVELCSTGNFSQAKMPRKNLLLDMFKAKTHTQFCGTSTITFQHIPTKCAQWTIMRWWQLLL